MQPFLSAANDLYVLRCKTHFFVEFAQQCLLRGFVLLDTALRELPAVLPAAPSPEYLIVPITENDAHVGSVALFVNHGCTCIPAR